MRAASQRWTRGTTSGSDLAVSDQQTVRSCPSDAPPPWRSAAGSGSGERPPLPAPLGWTQDELAHHAGVDHKSINRLENAAYSPSVDRLFLVAGALGVRGSELLDDSLD
jgi:DNA-binding XRE family transcriptional regulator